MAVVTETFSNGASAGGTLTLNSPAVAVLRVVGLIGAATAVAASSATIVTAAPGTGTNAQFTGTAAAPSASVVLGTGWVAASLVTVTYVPAGSENPNV